MIHYQGEDIEFQLRLKDVAQNALQNFSQVKRIVAYFYTHVSHMAKFSTNASDGHQSLLIGSDNKSATGCIKTQDTKLMQGHVKVDVYIEPKAGEIEQIRRVYTGIQILPTPIKEEAK